ncbi:MAG TPA: hypothetical protein VMU64_09970 [Acidimicrobiales bacterium]|nr:hypothetical protein [Acidimicrobiales bacterium]
MAAIPLIEGVGIRGLRLHDGPHTEAARHARDVDDHALTPGRHLGTRAISIWARAKKFTAMTVVELRGVPRACACAHVGPAQHGVET